MLNRIAGGVGFLGNRLADTLISRGAEVLVASCLVDDEAPPLRNAVRHLLPKAFDLDLRAPIRPSALHSDVRIHAKEGAEVVAASTVSGVTTKSLDHH